jgi:hypothetical protein
MTRTICEQCGREYNSKRSKARKAKEPERFCSKKCEKDFHANKMTEQNE